MENIIPEQRNTVKLTGCVTEAPKPSHTSFGEAFYLFSVSTARTSGNCDIIPVLLSEYIYSVNDIKPGDRIYVEGQFRSHNTAEQGEAAKLKLMVFASKFAKFEELEKENIELPRTYTEGEKKASDINEIVLDGFICKPPVYRITPMSREIADVMLAVNRLYHKSDYIPCVCWGRNAKFCGKRAVGDRVVVTGRIQSRTYVKKYPDGTAEERTICEVSCGSFEFIKPEETEAETQES